MMRSANSATRVLIVEDERIVARDIERCLLGRGFRVSGVTDTAEEAVRLADSGIADLLLVDIRLRGERDGIWAAEQLRRSGDLPVVFLTAYGDPETLARAKRTGPFAYVLKPFEDEELLRSIEVALALHKARTELCRAEMRETIAQFSAGLAHEALNSLFGLTSIVNVVELQLGEQAELQEHVARMRHAAGRIGSLVARLQELGAGPLQASACRMLPLCSQAAAAYQQASSAAPCRVEIDVSPHDEALGDAARLQVAFRNLLGNAIEHSPPNGTVRLSARRIESDGRALLECELTDDGPGFPAELRGTIRPFATTRRGSLGLGLAIAEYVIVRQHGGRLELSTSAEGGARVVIHLPAV